MCWLDISAGEEDEGWWMTKKRLVFMVECVWGGARKDDR